MRRRRFRDQRGTAVTETMMLTWIVILFVAATLQLVRTNQAIYSSIVGAHLLMFEGAWKANCYQKQDKCIYNSDGHAQVIWRPADLPEVLVPRVGMFKAYLPADMRLRAWPGAVTPRADGFKRTRMGAGTYYPICPCSIGVGTCMESRKHVPGFPQC